MRPACCRSREIVTAVILIAVAATGQTSVARQRTTGDLTIVETRIFKAADGSEVEAELGRLIVPEHRANPDSPLIGWHLYDPDVNHWSVPRER